jgi:hypothetical protein
LGYGWESFCQNGSAEAMRGLHYRGYAIVDVWDQGA